jgi:uncharacterized membrane protein YkvA (DUF1232 family)
MPKGRSVTLIRGVIAIIIGGIYIINPTAGLAELIPDVIPFIGNLDEAGATALLLWGIRELRGASSVKTINQ